MPNSLGLWPHKILPLLFPYTFRKQGIYWYFGANPHTSVFMLPCIPTIQIHYITKLLLIIAQIPLYIAVNICHICPEINYFSSTGVKIIAYAYKDHYRSEFIDNAEFLWTYI